MISRLSWPALTAVLNIVLIDLVLSGDNAAVIGLAIRNLAADLRKKAAILGTGAAVILRVAATSIVALLIRIPWCNTVGGVILLWITYKLLINSESQKNIRAESSFWKAVCLIVVADFSMSFDNVIGVAGAAHGSVPLVIFGLAVSIPVLIWGSNRLAGLMDKHPIIVFLGGAVLIHTSVTMIIRGLKLAAFIGRTPATLVPWLLALFLLVWGCSGSFKEKVRGEKLKS